MTSWTGHICLFWRISIFGSLGNAWITSSRFGSDWNKENRQWSADPNYKHAPLSGGIPLVPRSMLWLNQRRPGVLGLLFDSQQWHHLHVVCLATSSTSFQVDDVQATFITTCRRWLTRTCRTLRTPSSSSPLTRRFTRPWWCTPTAYGNSFCPLLATVKSWPCFWGHLAKHGVLRDLSNRSTNMVVAYLDLGLCVATTTVGAWLALTVVNSFRLAWVIATLEGALAMRCSGHPRWCGRTWTSSTPTANGEAIHLAYRHYQAFVWARTLVSPVHLSTVETWSCRNKAHNPLLFGNVDIPKTFTKHELRGLQRPEAQLIGRDSSGAYRTSFAKEYPEGMNWCFAAAFRAKMASSLPRLGDCTEMFPAFASELAAFAICVEHDGIMKPDYQPQWPELVVHARREHRLKRPSKKKNVYVYIYIYCYIAIYSTAL